MALYEAAALTYPYILYKRQNTYLITGLDPDLGVDKYGIVRNSIHSKVPDVLGP